MDEFALIRRHFAAYRQSAPDVVLGIGDDCALLHVPADRRLAVTTDTLIAGCHFPSGTAPFDIGWKSLAVNLSDLAAMGAQPRWFTLALTLPSADADWLDEFTHGLRTLAQTHSVVLVGGDTTRGALSITITAMGLSLPGRALRRSGARPGDVICVTGTLGDAALALRCLQANTAMGGNCDVLRKRLDRPQPRVEAGMALRGLATAAIDVSDGMAGDLTHILDASGCGAEIDADRLPRSPAFAAWATDAATAQQLQLHGGDDYELCLCLPPSAIPAAQTALASLDLPLSVVGRITAEPGLRLRCGEQLQTLRQGGYDHFAP